VTDAQRTECAAEAIRLDCDNIEYLLSVLVARNSNSPDELAALQAEIERQLSADTGAIEPQICGGCGVTDVTVDGGSYE